MNLPSLIRDELHFLLAGNSRAVLAAAISRRVAAARASMASTSGSTVGKGSTTLELIYGSISGMAFGLVSPLASQPFDTLKTKMQADPR
jgi:hypothetical protein